MSDHKAIREALEESERDGRVSCFVVGSSLRALLADLDAVRGLLLGIRQQDYLNETYRARIDAALKGASHD